MNNIYITFLKKYVLIIITYKAVPHYIQLLKLILHYDLKLKLENTNWFSHLFNKSQPFFTGKNLLQLVLVWNNS